MTSFADKIADAPISWGMCEAHGWSRQRAGSQGRPVRRPYPKLVSHSTSAPPTVPEGQAS
jgi:hypothetical protein